MYIEIEDIIDPEKKEVYRFNVMENLNIVFINWSLCIKPKGKRKWEIKTYWDKYQRPTATSRPEPTLPDKIRTLTKERACVQLTVKTWDEWKSNPVNN